MRQKLVVGNWKMHGSRDQVNKLVGGIIAGVKEVGDRVKIGICPTYIYLDQTAKLLAAANIGISLGAQNVNPEERGAYTGEVAARMLSEMEVSLVIIGHSERRELFGESSQLIAAKFRAVQANKMVPILCVGESLEEREQGSAEQVIVSQLEAVVSVVGFPAFHDAIIAYEPIWAIGTGKTATPEQAQEAHSIIREYLAKQNAAVAESVRILYGGSVKSTNARELFNQADIDGGLVGGASLEVEEFLSICKSAN